MRCRELAEPAIVDVLEKYKVLSRRELASRLEVYLEQYILSVHVEAKETAEMAKTTILPAALRYLGELAGVAANLKAVDLPYDADHAEDDLGAESPTCWPGSPSWRRPWPTRAATTSLEHAAYAPGALIPPMAKVRAAADGLEALVADDLWPLPTYQEMLHIL